MCEVKGSIIKTRLDYINEHATPDQKKALYEKISQETRQVLEGELLAGKWYPIEVLHDLHHIMDMVLGNGDKKRLPDIGAYSAQNTLTGIYRIFYKVGSPEFIVKRAASVWKQFYSEGEMNVEMLGDKKANLTLSGYRAINEEHAIVLQGWMKRTLELSGGKNVSVDITLGQAQCEFLGIWS